MKFWVGRPTSDQILIAQPFFGRTPNNLLHLFLRIQRATIVPPLKLVHVAMQVLRAHLVIRPVKPSLHHGPERLHSVCVGLLSNVLTYTVFYPKMITRYTYVSSCFGYRPQEYAAWKEAVAQFKDEVAEIGRGRYRCLGRMTVAFSLFFKNLSTSRTTSLPD